MLIVSEQLLVNWLTDSPSTLLQHLGHFLPLACMKVQTALLLMGLISIFQPLKLLTPHKQSIVGWFKRSATQRTDRFVGFPDTNSTY